MNQNLLVLAAGSAIALALASLEPAKAQTERDPAGKSVVTEWKPEWRCEDDVHASAPFNRPDLAYAVTGQDCFGDLPGESFKSD